MASNSGLVYVVSPGQAALPGCILMFYWFFTAYSIKKSSWKSMGRMWAHCLGVVCCPLPWGQLGLTHPRARPSLGHGAQDTKRHLTWKRSSLEGGVFLGEALDFPSFFFSFLEYQPWDFHRGQEMTHMCIVATSRGNGGGCSWQQPSSSEHALLGRALSHCSMAPRRGKQVAFLLLMPAPSLQHQESTDKH